MALADYLLYRVARNWPSPVANRLADFGAPSTDASNAAYARHQFDRKVRIGLQVAVSGLDVLEIGCGHGGISCYLASVGARHVVGIDINTKNLTFARGIVEEHERRLGGAKLPLNFVVTDARHMGFSDGSFDLIVADSLFEHVMDPEALLKESHRLLRPKGKLLVPLFSSIYSKNGLHLKHGLKMPWANLVFSEATILRALRRLADENPQLFEQYPGLRNNPQRVRDVRRYGDLNDITYGRFREMAASTGFGVSWFRPVPVNRFGEVLRRVPVVRDSLLMDIMSTGASALLVRQ
jgi:ubiquinone/menaquinone biosynthesis C-methylase UbiE